VLVGESTGSPSERFQPRLTSTSCVTEPVTPRENQLPCPNTKSRLTWPLCCDDTAPVASDQRRSASGDWCHSTNAPLCRISVENR